MPLDKAFYMDRGQSIRKQFAKKVRIYLFFFSFFYILVVWMSVLDVLQML